MPDKYPEKYKIPWAERRALRRYIRWIYDCNNEGEFMQILRNHGIKDEDPRFAEIVKLFRDLRSGKV